jgi:hypothetical protein
MNGANHDNRSIRRLARDKSSPDAELDLFCSVVDEVERVSAAWVHYRNSTRWLGETLRERLFWEAKHRGFSLPRDLSYLIRLLQDELD